MTYFLILCIASTLFYVSFNWFNEAAEEAEWHEFYRVNNIRKEETNLKASMSRVVECIRKIKEFEAKGYKDTTAYYRKELAQQRAWMNYHRNRLQDVKAA